MHQGGKVITWFAEVDKGYFPLVCDKGANLDDLTKTKSPVPPGFMITAEAYYYAE